MSNEAVTQKATAKPSTSKNKNVEILRGLALQGMTREKIMREMEISEGIFNKLFFKLAQIDGKAYPIAHSAPIRKTRVGKNGILVSHDKIQQLGLASIFKKGTELHVAREAEGIIISVVPEATGGTSNTSGGLYIPGWQDELEEALPNEPSVGAQNTTTIETEE